MATMLRKPASAPQNGAPQSLHGKTLREARNLLGRLQGSDVFRFYVMRRIALVIPALLLFVLISLACTAASVVFVAGTRPLIVLLALLLSPVVFLGSLFVQGYIFVSWLEGRALARAYPNAARPPQGPAAAWVARRLRSDLGTAPQVPWGFAVLFLFAPLGVLAFVATKLAVALIAAAVLLPLAYARFDR
jgi:hypothetical protein